MLRQNRALGTVIGGGGNGPIIHTTADVAAGAVDGVAGYSAESGCAKYGAARGGKRWKWVNGGIHGSRKIRYFQRLASTILYLRIKDYPNRGRTARKILDNQGDFKTAAAKSAAFQLGSDLAMIVDRWPSLPEHIKLAVLALIKCQSSG